MHATRVSCVYSEFDHHILLLNRHRHCLGDVGALDHLGPSGNLRRIGPRPHLGRLAPGLTGPDIELPTVPRAAYHLAFPDHAEIARPVADSKPGNQAIAQPAALVRAAVKQAVELTIEIEDADRPPGDREHFVGANWDLCNGGNNVSSHGAWQSHILTPGPLGRAARNDRVRLLLVGASYATEGQADNLLLQPNDE